MKSAIKKILKSIKALKKKIKDDYKAEIVGVFGSYARGEQKKTSDVDIIVRFHEGATLFDFVGLADFLEEKLGIKVDIVSEKGIRKELKSRILKEAIAV